MTKSLLDEMRAAQPTKGPTCGVHRLLNALDKKEGDQLAEAIADSTILSSVITRVLDSRGHRLGRDTVARHRRGDCNCER